MSNQTFLTLINEAHKLYKEDNIQQAIDMLNKAALHVPRNSSKITFLKICLTSKMNKPTQAIEILEESIKTGNWYSESLLRDHPDLDLLQGIPKFEHLIDKCKNRQTKAQKETVSKLIISEPNTMQPWPLLMVLHGNSSSAKDAEENWNFLVKKEILLAYPQSSCIIGTNAYNWNNDVNDEQMICAYYRMLKKKYLISENKVILGGFSMGGGLAIKVALEIGLCGFIAIAPYIPDIDRLIPLMENDKMKNIRGYIIVGDKDENCYECSKKLANELKKKQIPYKLEIQPDLCHSYPLDCDVALLRALNFVFKK